MLDDIRHHILSPTDAAKWLRHVVTEEMTRIKRNRAIVFADGGADPSADWSMAEAWKLLASRGPGAVLGSEDRKALVDGGRSEADIRQLEISLEMLSADLRSEPHVRRMTRAFSDLTGQTDSLSAGITLALRKLMIKGRAAAWARTPEDQGVEIASEIAATIAADMVAAERSSFLGASDARGSSLGVLTPERPATQAGHHQPPKKKASAMTMMTPVTPTPSTPLRHPALDRAERLAACKVVVGDMLVDAAKSKRCPDHTVTV